MSKHGLQTYPESAAARGYLNPFLLVRADFWRLSRWSHGNIKWNPEYFHNLGPEKKDLSLYPREDVLVFSPKEGRAEIVYNITDFISAINEMTLKPLTADQTALGLHFQNAKDMGLNYVSLSKAESANLGPKTVFDAPTEVIAYYGAVPIAGKKGEYLNYLSPSLPGFEYIEVAAFPAQLTLHFWREPTDSIEKKADFIFSIKII